MAITLENLYQRTGVKLEIVRAEESLSAEDGALIAQFWLGLHDQLLSEALMTFGVDEDIPEWAAPIMVEMLAAMLVDEFGVEEPRRSTVRAEGIVGNAPPSPAEKRLRRQVAQPYISNTLQSEYF